jgi:glyoxylase I family protein
VGWFDIEGLRIPRLPATDFMAAAVQGDGSMPATGLNHYNIKAPQDTIERVRDFYVEIVGLRVGARPPFRFPGYWLYAGDRPVLHLVVTSGPAPDTGAGTIDHVAFDSEDFEATRALLAARGVAFRFAEVPGSGVRQLFVQDPAGNGVELQFAAPG